MSVAPSFSGITTTLIITIATIPIVTTTAITTVTVTVTITTTTITTIVTITTITTTTITTITIATYSFFQKLLHNPAFSATISPIIFSIREETR